MNAAAKDQTAARGMKLESSLRQVRAESSGPTAAATHFCVRVYFHSNKKQLPSYNVTRSFRVGGTLNLSLRNTAAKSYETFADKLAFENLKCCHLHIGSFT